MHGLKGRYADRESCALVRKGATAGAPRPGHQPAWAWALALLPLAGLLWSGVATAAGTPGPGVAKDSSGRPAEVRSWRHEILDQEAYAGLARQWEAYVQGHPKDARAWVEWGNALRYSGKRDEALEKYDRAFAVDSTDAAAISARQFLSSAAKDSELRLSHRRLLGAAGRDPSYPVTYYNLWTTSLYVGDQALADQCLRRVAEIGDMPGPLLEFGANIVNGAPPGAIILTNGDNDTYPPQVYQVLTGQRKDVAIVNLGMLNLPWYVRYWRGRGLPITLSDATIDKYKDDDFKQLLGPKVVENLFENVQKPGSGRSLHYCVTVSDERKTVPAKLVREGLLERFVPDPKVTECCPQDVDLQRTRELVDTVYRLDAATDPFFDWQRENAIAMLMRNYMYLLSHLGENLVEEGKADAAGPYLFRAVEIGAFHHNDEFAQGLVDAWQKKDAGGRLLPAARALVGQK